jgi:hypothetical protein
MANADGDSMTNVGRGALELEFCGQLTDVTTDPFIIGRDGDFVVEAENRFLHRRFLSLSSQRGLWLLTNIGRALTATVSDVGGRLEAFLAPGAALPIVFDETRIRFAAGPTSYEFSLRLAEPTFSPGPTEHTAAGDTTVGRVALTPDQMRLVLALAEPALRGLGRSAWSIPASSEAAQRLGWTMTKFNRKLDNVCQKLAGQGVRGLHGKPGRLASNRRARLVEYALAIRLVTLDDLALLARDHGQIGGAR